MNDDDDACVPADATRSEDGAAFADDVALHEREHAGEPGCDDANALREQAAVLAARLAAHHRARRALFGWMHPARVALLPCAQRLNEVGGSRTAVLAEAFLADAGFAAPALTHFEPAYAALALLPPQAVLGVFRLRALLDHAHEVLGWIDRPRRALLANWVGAEGVRLLLTRRRELGGESSLSARTARAPALDMHAGDALAWRGLRLFERECGWRADVPLAMMQLALPTAAADLPLARFMPSPSPVPRARELCTADSRADRQAPRLPSLAIVAQLPALYPEAAW